MSNRRIIDYKIVENGQVTELAVAVKAHIDSGWQPYGSLAVHPYDSNNQCTWYVQAMVYYHPDDQ